MTDQLQQLRETFGIDERLRTAEKRRFDESMVERWPEGDERGGQFAPKRTHNASTNTTGITGEGYNENMGGIPFTDEASMEAAAKDANWEKNNTGSAKKKSYVSRWVNVSGGNTKGGDWIRLESSFISDGHATVTLQRATATGEGDKLTLGQRVIRPGSSAIPSSIDVVSWIKNDVWDKPSRVG